jgi:hypothetical protein
MLFFDKVRLAIQVIVQHALDSFVTQREAASGHFSLAYFFNRTGIEVE